jgi:hypothetical protein
MKNKTLIVILKILAIAFILFFTKHFVQALIEYTDIIPVKPKAYIWGMTNRAKYVIGWQFIFTFWVYILTVILFYFILKVKLLEKLKTWKVVSVLSILTSLFLLFVHRYQFPYKRVLSKTNPIRFNYAYFEELIIYSIVCFMLIYLIRKWLLKYAGKLN